MSNTPNPNRKRKMLGRDLSLWRANGRVHTARGSMSEEDYRLLQAARAGELPALEALPVRTRF